MLYSIIHDYELLSLAFGLPVMPSSCIILGDIRGSISLLRLWLMNRLILHLKFKHDIAILGSRGCAIPTEWWTAEQRDFVLNRQTVDETWCQTFFRLKEKRLSAVRHMDSVPVVLPHCYSRTQTEKRKSSLFSGWGGDDDDDVAAAAADAAVEVAW